MLEDTTNPGLIPDFFHDVIAFFLPGYFLIFLIWINNLLLLGGEKVSVEISLGAFFFISVAAYVLGRILGQIGLWAVHHREFPKFWETIPGPKWSLLFDEDNDKYSRPFKKNVIRKIEEWLKDQDGEALIKECRSEKRDDYFNLIQFYLRERFPSVALFEKKQNANITLMRSLAIAFFINIVLYSIELLLLFDLFELSYSKVAAAWLSVCLLCSFVAYHRFRLDQQYHAMYVFETFVSMKKLLKKDKSMADG